MGTGELAPQVRALAALAENPCSVPSTHVRWFTAPVTPDPGGLTLFWPLGAQHSLSPPQTHD